MKITFVNEQNIFNFLNNKNTGWFSPKSKITIFGITLDNGDFFFLEKGILSSKNHPSIFKSFNSNSDPSTKRVGMFFFDGKIHREDGPAVLSVHILYKDNFFENLLGKLNYDLKTANNDVLGDSFWYNGEQIISEVDKIYSFSNIKDAKIFFIKKICKLKLFNQI